MDQQKSATITFGVAAFDCPDPAALSQFYADLLGGTAHVDDDWAEVVWDGPTLAFQLAPNHEDPHWPSGQQQAHLDFVVEDIATAHRRVLELGGRAVEPTGEPQPAPEQGFRVYTDPAGHPFCLCRPNPQAWD